MEPSHLQRAQYQAFKVGQSSQRRQNLQVFTIKEFKPL
ncbi:hypothetical protein NC653_029816 [Populus alba x Populus x berolinensis]|uniref:Uncharacterized protein n=1 Tax=Populus alba x Populus x berolinensis TaxID=444605 RepID=A0AAD6M3G3_9ROSI|nr:hypothetical protein NC653_029816 [Populus alba x Populus x berolinensis]